MFAVRLVVSVLKAPDDFIKIDMREVMLADDSALPHIDEGRMETHSTWG
jgi:hypothetical protein